MTDANARRDFNIAMGWSLKHDPEAVDVRRRYWMGDQVRAAELPEDVRSQLAGLITGPTGKGFGINFCARHIAGLGALIRVEDVKAPDDAGQAQAEFVRRRLELSGWGLMQRRLFDLADVDGIGFAVIGDGPDGGPMVYHHPAVGGEQGAEDRNGVQVLEVDRHGRPQVAVKYHTERRVVRNELGALVRMADAARRAVGAAVTRSALKEETWAFRTVYYPDRIERYVTPPRSAERPCDPKSDAKADGTPGPEPVTAYAYSRLPIIPFVHPRGHGELDPILPLQRDVNHAWLTLQDTAIRAGFPIMYGINTDKLPEDAQMKPGRWWHFNTKNGAPGTVGTIAAADMSKLMERVKLSLDLCAFIAGYPTFLLPHHWSGQPPSGVALESAMAPMIDNASDHITRYDDPAADLFGLLLEFGGQPEADLRAEWFRPDYETAVEKMAAATGLQTLNAHPEVVLRRAGLRGDDLTKSLDWQEQAQEEQDARILAAITDAATATAATPGQEAEPAEPPVDEAEPVIAA